MEARPPTPSQTIGPFFHGSLNWAVTRDLDRLGDDEWRVVGKVIDSNGDGVSDALLEIWQPQLPRSSGASVAAGFQRAYTDKVGQFAFTVRRARCTERGDGAPASASAWRGAGVPATQATPDPTVVHVTVFARGLLGALRTRLYAGASLEQLRARSELQHVPQERLASLIPSSTDPERRTLNWSVRLRGDGETVFFAWA